MDIFSNDNQQQGMMPDSDFMNHPGFLGGTWWADTFNPGGQEAKRYADELNALMVKCNYVSTTNCQKLAVSLQCGINARNSALLLKFNTPARKRVRNRKIKASGAVISQIKSKQNSLGCVVGNVATGTGNIATTGTGTATAIPTGNGGWMGGITGLTGMGSGQGRRGYAQAVRFIQKSDCGMLNKLGNIVQNTRTNKNCPPGARMSGGVPRPTQKPQYLGGRRMR